MSLDQQLSSQRHENWRKGTLATKCLKSGISDTIDENVKQQHDGMLSYIQKQYGTASIECRSCSLKTVLPLHTKNSDGKCPLGNSNCNCKNTKGRKLCPTKFCSAMYDQLILQHRYRSPNWTNTDIRQWHKNHWEIAKCNIPVNGYKKKNTAAETDCSGLIHIVINDLALQIVLDCPIDPPDDVFSKTREARNEMMHSADMELDETELKAYIQDMITILKDKKTLSKRPEALSAINELQRIREGYIKIPKCTVCDDGKDILDMLNRKKLEAEEAIKNTTKECLVKISSIACECKTAQNVKNESDKKIIKKTLQQGCMYSSSINNNSMSTLNEEDAFSIATSSIVAEYISYKIEKAGFNWQVSPTRNCPDNKVINTVKKLCSEFEKRYEEQFSEMRLACAEVVLNSNNYMGVLDQLTLDGLHWGRVVAIFSFAGGMSVYCMKNGKTERVDWIREWTCQFLDNKVENWINENNGWKGIVDYYNLSDLAPEERGNGWAEERGNGWGSVIIGGALGAFGIGALIMNKA